MYITMEDLKGLTFTNIELIDYNNGDELVFTSDSGDVYNMYHAQDCCENVELDDICGDLSDLVNTPILDAREEVSDTRTEGEQMILDGEAYVMHKLSIFGAEEQTSFSESETWTFYLFRTIKGSVTLRWHGSSNGYYSESVNIYKS